jgi:RluA family pseudouridine synthase
MNAIVYNGVRKIPSYYYTNKVYSKQRWFGRTVVDVVSSEFNHTDVSSIVVNSAIVRRGDRIIGAELESLTIQNGDVLEYTGHYHEPPIIAFGDRIDIIHEDETVIVVNKPAGMPTHPSGKYRHNSLSEILSEQLGHPVYPTHRLDRLTSGVVIFAKTTKAASQFRLQLVGGQVRKEYYARVSGKFPEATELDFPLFDIDGKRDFDYFMSSVVSAKNCCTLFRLLRYDQITNQSVVSCMPLTGRTHQIRKHLAILGHPIYNDKLYGRPIFRELSLLVRDRRQSLIKEAFLQLQAATTTARSDKVTGGVCPQCHGHLFKDPEPDELWIALHASKYWMEAQWCYETATPRWATIDSYF